MSDNVRRPKVAVVIPDVRDTDRRLHEAPVFGYFLFRLCSLEGCSSPEISLLDEPFVRRIDGRVFSRAYRIAFELPEERVDDLRQVLREACVIFSQRAILLRYPTGKSEYLEATTTDR